MVKKLEKRGLSYVNWFANFYWVYYLIKKSTAITIFSSHPFQSALRSPIWICTYLLVKNSKIMQSLKMNMNNLVSSHFCHLSKVRFNQAEKIHVCSLKDSSSSGSAIKPCTCCKCWKYVLDCLPADSHLLKLSLCNFPCMKPNPKITDDPQITEFTTRSAAFLVDLWVLKIMAEYKAVICTSHSCSVWGNYAALTVLSRSCAIPGTQNNAKLHCSKRNE